MLKKAKGQTSYQNNVSQAKLFQREFQGRHHKGARYSRFVFCLQNMTTLHKNMRKNGSGQPCKKSHKRDSSWKERKGKTQTEMARLCPQDVSRKGLHVEDAQDRVRIKGELTCKTVF